MQYIKSKKYCFILFFLLIFCIAGCTPAGDHEDPGSKLPGEFSFIYMADTQADPDTGDYTAWGQLLKEAAAHESRPAFIMIGGDLVNDGDDSHEWDAFFSAGGKTLENFKVYPAAGNHDNTPLLRELFHLPDNGPAGDPAVFYSFDYGDAHFTVMDSNAMGAARQEHIDWLRQDLSASDKSYKIVMFHHPAYPAVNIPRDQVRAETIQQAFIPVMEEAGVDLVLTGHQHVYMRTHPLLQGRPDREGIVHLMVTSGGKHYHPQDYDYMACSRGHEAVYTIVHVHKKGISLETINARGQVIDSTLGPHLSPEQSAHRLTVSGDGIEGEQEFTLGELAEWPASGFDHTYSTINNWPSAGFYAARGIKVERILQAAGVLDTAQIITFRAADGYEVSFTRRQLLGQTRYFYPGVIEGESGGAEMVDSIIAYAYQKGALDPEQVRNGPPCLFIGQSHPREQTNPTFVSGVTEILVSSRPAISWEAAGTFPAPGPIAAGELVKLQHPSFGLVKLYYTLDGTDPTEHSQLYNVSTYQPELNVPITISGDTTIKVLVTGYGRENSEIKSFTFKVQ